MIETKKDIELWFKKFYAHGKFDEDMWEWKKFCKNTLLQKLENNDYKGE